jgi:hypothetical protein
MGRIAELIVTRKLANGGNTLVLSQTLKIEGGTAGTSLASDLAEESLAMLVSCHSG